MQIAGAATSRAHGKFPDKMRFRAGRKRRRFLVPHMDPLNLLVCANRVRNAIERIAGNAINLPDSCFGKNIHQQIGYFFLRHKTGLIEGSQRELSFSLISLGFLARPLYLSKTASSFDHLLIRSATCTVICRAGVEIKNIDAP
jgi:hypothetical protein